MKLICEEMQELQLVNWRQAADKKGHTGQSIYDAKTPSASEKVYVLIRSNNKVFSFDRARSYNKSSLLGRGVISTAVEFVILIFVSSTRWYS